MPNTIPPPHISSKVARAVERFGEKKFWYNILSPLILNFLPIFPRKRPPQTPQTLSQNQTRAAAVLDFGTVTKPSHSFVKDLEKRPVYQLIFLNEEENQGVEVKEVDEIDFTEVKRRVEKGDSVFITRKESEKVDTSSLMPKTKKKDR
jgi:hypothetical protein